MWTMQSRRRFLAGAAMAGAAGLLGTARSLHAESPPETTSVRLPKMYGDFCQASKYVAKELLRAEGITDVQYVEGEVGVDNSIWIARGETDFDLNFPTAHIASIAKDVPIKVLTGLHSGCLELVANDSIQSITDLKGKRVGVDTISSQPHWLLTIMTAYVGLDPSHDIQWVTHPDAIAMELFIDGKIDAFLATAPEPQELRARKIGHTVLNTTVDQPWSQYFCCMLAGAADYVTSYPVATKRVMRALLKAADLCAAAPSGTAQTLVDDGLTDRLDLAVQTLNEIRYDRWREFDPEDTLRFYALRMHEAGLIEVAPNRIIADGTDWRFLDELKRELKT